MSNKPNTDVGIMPTNRDLKESQEALQKMMGGKKLIVTASAASPTADNHSVGSVTSSEAADQHSTSHGGDNNGGDKNGGGGGGGGSSGSPGFKLPKLSTIMVFCSIITGLSIVYFTYWRTTPDGVKNDQRTTEVDLAKAQVKLVEAQAAIAAASGMAPAGYISNGATGQAQANLGQQQVSAVPVLEKVTVYAKTFSCTNDEDRENGYALNPAHNINLGSQAFQAMSGGCVLTKFSGVVSKLEARGYVLSVADPQIPGNYYNCGDFNGNNNSLQQCSSFITGNTGREMRIAILDGGYVKIN